MGLTYKDSGVDIEKGDRFAEFIGSIPSKAIGKIGGFAGGVEINTKKYKNPVLFSCTDGVGTKLLVAQKLKKFDTVGIDLVAMSVNDLIVCGVEPLSFLDYIAIGKIDEDKLHQIIKGVVDGCEQSECILAGGETAEMPDIYEADDFDLAGFCVGVADKKGVLPKKDEIKEGDVILALPSVGVHSNGLSLARKALKNCGDEVWRELLTPTKIYVKEMKKLLTTGKILGAAHITGGGLEGNTVRVMNAGLVPSFTWDWNVPNIFKTIAEEGKIVDKEMRKVFNMGIGVALVVHPQDAKKVLDVAKSHSIEIFVAGKVVRG